MDKLLRAAEFYKENLAGRKFHLTAGKSGKKIEFDIVFNADNFKHLAGLHKLTDIPLMQRGGEIIYRQILSGQTTLEDIKKSNFFDDIEVRLDNFSELKDTLIAKKLMLKSSHGRFNSISADFMLTKQNNEYGYAHLFLGKDKGKEDYTFPVTFIIQPDNLYLINNPEKWTVLSIEEVKRAEQLPTQKKTKK
jgi:hypothetical protein